MAHRVPRSDTKPVYLTQHERRKLLAASANGQLSPRVSKRIRVLLLLADGWAPTDLARTVGCAEATVRRVRQRFETSGIVGVLADAPRPGRPIRVSQRTANRIVAMVLGPPPDGCSRWTVRLATDEARARGLVQHVSRERVRLLFRDHALKPWRQEDVVCRRAR